MSANTPGLLILWRAQKHDLKKCTFKNSDDKADGQTKAASV